MLGTHTAVAVYGSISRRGVYTGYLCGEAFHGKPVYIISRRNLRDQFNGVIIALSPQKGGEEAKIIVAPEGDIFYEPQIRERLRGVRGLDISQLSCLYEKSCGAVIFYRSPEGNKVLLVKNHNGKYWSFPKGHVEKGESEKQTALREIKEETGLDVKIFDHYRQISDYCPFGKIKKRVIFFLAETETDRVDIQQDEIDSFVWATFAQAEKMCSYENDLRVLHTARRYIDKNDAHKSKPFSV